MNSDSEHPAETRGSLHAGTAGAETHVSPLTPQQVFDNALHGVIAQGAFSRRFDSVSAGATCVYRKGELKCGIGQSIPDALYMPEFDEPPSEGPLSILNDNGTDICTLCDAVPAVGAIFARCNVGFLSGIQEAHDRAKDMDDFRDRMRQLAADCGLTYTEPDAPADSGQQGREGAPT